jgi:DNA-binding response OmpR family regulator
VSSQSKIVAWLISSGEEKKLLSELNAQHFICLECADRSSFDSIITKHQHDIGMILLDESVSGDKIPELCRELKGNSLLHSLLLVLADNGSLLSEVDVLDSGADIFIQKPLKPVLLAKRIGSVLARR